MAIRDITLESINEEDEGTVSVSVLKKDTVSLIVAVPGNGYNPEAGEYEEAFVYSSITVKIKDLISAVDLVTLAFNSEEEEAKEREALEQVEEDLFDYYQNVDDRPDFDAGFTDPYLADFPEDMDVCGDPDCGCQFDPQFDPAPGTLR